MFFVNFLIASVTCALIIAFLFYKKRRLVWDGKSKFAVFLGAGLFLAYIIYVLYSRASTI